jgi:hypothetical protein
MKLKSSLKMDMHSPRKTLSYLKVSLSKTLKSIMGIEMYKPGYLTVDDLPEYNTVQYGG